ncbi:sulfate adenylyltransferase [Photobacterium frigidiphilum]|uniref:Sulfate adenylyltransferase n=1 Tax=Photobacterium frigidiphilum TaxID=264736 RepID=A0A2T3J8Y2_9GAMM|nr:transglutaminase-like cysteine peptidase [Photobacterium frigidiphilum]PSU45255.1 sulfate adenylyltransferase [Photobacterium frigidiphilum]
MKRVAFWVLALLLSTSAIALTDKESKQINTIMQFYGERAGKRVTAWRNIVNDNASQDIDTKLQEVNNFFNQLIFIDDIKLWGKEDFWATPLEFLGVGAGDCEDFSIAKYFSLRELGVADNKLRLVYVKALELNQFHMVVAYYPTPSSVPLLLDNLNGDIKPATERPDLLPIYSFNASKLWLMKQKGQGQLAGKASRLSLWNDLRQRSDRIKLNRPKINFDE